MHGEYLKPRAGRFLRLPRIFRSDKGDETVKMDVVAGSGNDEFYTPGYAIKPLLPFIPEDSHVWCPFDTGRSLIYQMIREKNPCTPTHLDMGFDFFKTPALGDIIISNPPYSLKTEVFQRLFEIGKPFAMLVGVVGLFESQKRFNMFASNEFEVMYFNKRISYLKSYDDEKPALNPPFSSVWLCSKLLPEKNMFVTVSK